MPNRVVRGQIDESVSLSRVSLEAEFFFRKLINNVDDYGRGQADPEILAAHCFPRRRSVTPKAIAGWIQELTEADGDGRGPVLLYEVDGRPFLWLVNWERYRGNTKRGAKSKWPLPPKIPDWCDPPADSVRGDGGGTGPGDGSTGS